MSKENLIKLLNSQPWPKEVQEMIERLINEK